MEKPSLHLHREAEGEYSLDTPEGRAARALMVKDLDLSELMSRLAHRTTKFCQLVDTKVPAVILERQRALCREVFEELMTRGAGRSRPRE